MSASEIELKLQARPEDLARLRTAPLFAGSGDKAVTRSLESVYFDTPDLRLHGHAFSLRVRRQGRSYVQTLKAGGETTGGALVRGEWEAPVAGRRPNLSLLPAEVLGNGVGALDEAELKPVFESHVKRTVRTLRPQDGVEVEVAFDAGEIRGADGQVLPLAEIELELKQGADPTCLYDVALALNELAPLRVELRSKSDRGYALAKGDRPSWSKAGKLDLDPADTVEQALAAITRHCMAHLVANEAVALAGEQPEGVHQMRVALRRLRSALAIFRPFIPDTQYGVLVGEVKWLAGAFGAARDWDVFLEELFAPVDLAFPGHPALAALRQAALASRARAYQGVRDAILSPRYTALLLKVGAWVDGRGWRDQPVSEHSAELFRPVADMAGALLAKRHRTVRKRGKGFASLDSEHRHEVRISLKKLRYAVEFFRTLFEAKGVRRYLDDLAGLQDALGHLQDVATVNKLVALIPAESGGRAPAGWETGAGMVIGWHARGLRDLEPAIVADWSRFAETKPFWSTPVRTE